MNRYQGNSGKMERIPESGQRRQDVFYRPAAAQPVMQARPPRLRKEESRGGLGLQESVGDSLRDKFSGVFSKITELETEDLILLLILYLMYRESHDEQYLIILGIMLFL